MGCRHEEHLTNKGADETQGSPEELGHIIHVHAVVEELEQGMRIAALFKEGSDS